MTLHDIPLEDTFKLPEDCITAMRVYNTSTDGSFRGMRFVIRPNQPSERNNLGFYFAIVHSTYNDEFFHNTIQNAIDSLQARPTFYVPYNPDWLEVQYG